VRHLCRTVRPPHPSSFAFWLNSETNQGMFPRLTDSNWFDHDSHFADDDRFERQVAEAAELSLRDKPDRYTMPGSRPDARVLATMSERLMRRTAPGGALPRINISSRASSTDGIPLLLRPPPAKRARTNSTQPALTKPTSHMYGSHAATPRPSAHIASKSSSPATTTSPTEVMPGQPGDNVSTRHTYDLSKTNPTPGAHSAKTSSLTTSTMPTPVFQDGEEMMSPFANTLEATDRWRSPWHPMQFTPPGP
jgi:hypothetical protein